MTAPFRGRTPRSTRFVRSALLALALLGTSAAAQPLPVRSLAAPPEELVSGRLHLPDPATLGALSGAALLPVRLEPAPDGARHGALDLPLAHGEAAIALVAPDASGWSLRLVAPDGAIDLAASGRVLRRDAALDPIARGAADTVRHDLLVERAGPHRLEIVAPPGAPEEALVLVRDASRARLKAHLVRLGATTGEPVAFRAWMTDDAARTPGAPAPARGAIERAEAIVLAPDGGRTVVTLRDGGGAFVPAAPGPHAVLVVAHGRDADGAAVVRTASLVVTVSASTLAVGDRAVGADDADGVWRIAIPVVGDAATERVIVAAEAWAHRADGTPAPAAWLAGLRDGPAGEGVGALELDLDPRWLDRAGLRPPLELRAVRVHDAGSCRPIAQAERLPVDLPDDALRRRSPALAPGAPPDAAMLRGRPGRHAVTGDTVGAALAAPGAHGIMLVHGYCSDGNPYPPSDFTGEVAIFHDPAASRTNDAFAQLLRADGALLKSHGVVAHSQGGMAALHLLVFYWSALDWASGGRPIQGVGVPWQGTALAGDAAIIGQIFGFGCGVNDDLTYDGAALWLSTIPGWARAQTWTWATTFADTPAFNDYCNFLTDLLLDDPEDGVVERWSTILPGGNDMGLVEGWCHIEGMRDPAQTLDHARNAIMNAEAAR